MDIAGSPNTLYKFIREHIAEEHEPEDRSGRTPLQALAGYLSSLESVAPELQTYQGVSAQPASSSSFCLQGRHLLPRQRRRDVRWSGSAPPNRPASVPM